MGAVVTAHALAGRRHRLSSLPLTLAVPELAEDSSMTDSIRWSDALKAQTREALDSGGLDLPPVPGGLVAFKHADGGYGTMQLVDLMQARFYIRRRKGGAVERFTSVDAVIESGWVLD